MEHLVVRIGIDIGQKVDPTTIAVAEVERRGGHEHFVVRHLERLPLGLSYPAVASRLARIIDGVEQQRYAVQRRDAAGRPAELDLIVRADATGVGQPIVDVLNESGATVTPVYFTHGDRRTDEGRQITLGKGWLVARLKALLQQERIHLPPQHPEAEATARELETYEIRVSDDANERYGAFATGAHDDLVTALGLACLGEPNRRAVVSSWLGRTEPEYPAVGWWND